MSSDHSTRRSFITAAGGFFISLLAPAAARPDRRKMARQTQELTLYVGTYTSGKSEGIYVYRMNPATGELRHFDTVKGVVNPSYLAIDPQRRRLYAVNEVDDFNHHPAGAVSAFSIDRQTAGLTLLNQQSSLGGSPCYLTVDRTGKYVLLANYQGGSVAVLPVRADGGLGAATEMVQHHGSGPNRQRQEGPHAHCITLDGANRYAFAIDLGTDKVMIYRFDARRGKLAPNRTPWAAVKPGAGPRHLAFHPGGRFAYVINELDSTITVFTYAPARGALTAIQTVPTLPADFTGDNTCADVHVSPSGKFLYGSNRGHDSLVVFAIEGRTGKLRHVQHEPTGGKTPRNFAIDPSGRFLLAANQDSDTIRTFRIDPREGRLTATGHVAQVPSPVCLKLIPSFS
jgi:6-phosphogluconolactonase